MLLFKKLHPGARLPVYATEGAACFDFYALVENGAVSCAPLTSISVDTGLAVEIPADHVMLLFSRSGHGFKNGVRLGNCVGVVDSDYRGEIRAKLANDGEHEFVVSNGDRIMQGMILPVERQKIFEVEELSTTERGEGGYGSTGTGEIVKKVEGSGALATIEQISEKRFKDRLDKLTKHE